MNSSISQVFLSIYSELANNPLIKRLIDVLDENKDGSISFFEFVAGLSQLSSTCKIMAHISLQGRKIEICIQSVRYQQRWLHFEWRAL